MRNSHQARFYHKESFHSVKYNLLFRIISSLSFSQANYGIMENITLAIFRQGFSLIQIHSCISRGGRMARKKKRRSKKLKKQLKFELIGLLFIFLAIFGSGASAISDGVIPGGLEHIFRFFLGIWYFVASVILLITGIILVVKRRKPDFSNRKMAGFIIFFIGLLLITHIQTYESLVVSENISIIATTWDQFFNYLSGQA